jgi:hypothetical protein
MATTAEAIEIINRAHTRREPDALLDLMADDARLVEYTRASGPSAPHVAEGKEAVEVVLRDVFSRDMTHEVSEEIVGPDSVSYIVSCEYPDGTRVSGAYVAKLDDGEIVELIGHVTWDE